MTSEQICRLCKDIAHQGHFRDAWARELATEDGTPEGVKPLSEEEIPIFIWSWMNGNYDISLKLKELMAARAGALEQGTLQESPEEVEQANKTVNKVITTLYTIIHYVSKCLGWMAGTFKEQEVEPRLAGGKSPFPFVNLEEAREQELWKELVAFFKASKDYKADLSGAAGARAAREMQYTAATSCFKNFAQIVWDNACLIWLACVREITNEPLGDASKRKFLDNNRVDLHSFIENTRCLNLRTEEVDSENNPRCSFEHPDGGLQKFFDRYLKAGPLAEVAAPPQPPKATKKKEKKKRKKKELENNGEGSSRAVGDEASVEAPVESPAKRAAVVVIKKEDEPSPKKNARRIELAGSSPPRGVRYTQRFEDPTVLAFTGSHPLYRGRDYTKDHYMDLTDQEAHKMFDELAKNIGEVATKGNMEEKMLEVVNGKEALPRDQLWKKRFCPAVLERLKESRAQLVCARSELFGGDTNAAVRCYNRSRLQLHLLNHMLGKSVVESYWKKLSICEGYEVVD